jgi:hypothetical protein
MTRKEWYWDTNFPLRTGTMEETSTNSRDEDDSTTKAAATAGSYSNVLERSLANNTIASWAVIVLSSLLLFWHSV